MTLLSIINRVQAVVNLPITTTVYSNTGEAQKQLLALCNMAGDVLMREYDWQALVSEGTFVTTATEQQTNGSLPSDCDRVINETLWNRTTTDPIFGPLSSQSWQSQKAQVAAAVWSQYRIRSNYFYLYPAPSASQNIYYEYVSNKWCQSSGGTAQTAWAADTDTGKIPEHLLTLGTIWRWLEAKGLDYSNRYEEYEREKSKIIARDGTRRRVSVVGPNTMGLGRGRVPEGSWS